MQLPRWALAVADENGCWGSSNAALASVTSLANLDERTLVAKAQAGNRVAFEELVRRFDRDVLRLALNLMKRPEDARDVYQEAFLKVYRNLHRFRFECSFGITDFFERQREHRPTLDPERSMMGQEIKARIAHALERLSPRERVVFEMKHYQGLKLRAIGDALGTTEETVKNSLFRATRKLRNELGGLR